MTKIKQNIENHLSNYNNKFDMLYLGLVREKKNLKLENKKWEKTFSK
jgi:hypothetical protein